MKNKDYLIEVMGLVGFTVVQLQRVEQVITYCWLLYSRRENKKVAAFVFDRNFEEMIQHNSKKVLGRFLSDIKSSGQFKTSFNKRFERFLDKRNRLIHRIFKEKTYANFQEKRALQRLHRFVSSIFHDAFFFEKVFDAYLGMSFELLAEQPEYKIDRLDELKELMAQKRSNGEMALLQKAIKMR